MSYCDSCKFTNDKKKLHFCKKCINDYCDSCYISHKNIYCDIYDMDPYIKNNKKFVLSQLKFSFRSKQSFQKNISPVFC